jgi:hypothetical protein
LVLIDTVNGKQTHSAQCASPQLFTLFKRDAGGSPGCSSQGSAGSLDDGKMFISVRDYNEGQIRSSMLMQHKNVLIDDLTERLAAAEERIVEQEMELALLGEQDVVQDTRLNRIEEQLAAMQASLLQGAGRATGPSQQAINEVHILQRVIHHFPSLAHIH